MVSNYLTSIGFAADQVQTIQQFLENITKAVAATILNIYQEIYPEPATGF